jgi:hypothetical protein
MKKLKSNPEGCFSTHLGFAKYDGCDVLYDGNLRETFRGTKEEVIEYLRSMLPELDGQSSVKWPGGNGSWYMGQAGIDAIMAEIESPFCDRDEEAE